jgi:thiamine biosynthesis lipoprotein
MGTSVEILLVGRAGEDHKSQSTFALAEALADDWERTFSRFRPESELSRLNARTGRPVAVSERLFAAIEIALDANRQTHGIFDPTVLPALLALGYDRTFADLRDDGHRPDPLIAPGVAGIRADPTTRQVWLPPGTQLDLGGIVKGLYVDVLAGVGGWTGGAVSAGGDLRIWGISPAGSDWTIGVEDPEDPERDVALLHLNSGAVATSGTNRRNWQRGGLPIHHLIDPPTGLPARSGVRAVSVVSATGVQAEVAATALAVGGPDASFDRSIFRQAVVILDDGTQMTVPGSMEGRVNVEAHTLRAALAV